jgi:hypothetical protein
VATNTPTPVTTGYPQQFRAEYFNNKTLSGSPALIRYEDAVEYGSGWGNPPNSNGSPDPVIRRDGFSARWIKSFYVPTTTTYRFRLDHDDGLRIYIGDSTGAQRTIYNKWQNGIYQKTIYTQLNAGWNTIKIEYYENTGRSHIYVRF